jgi:hypothetical protein
MDRIQTTYLDNVVGIDTRLWAGISTVRITVRVGDFYLLLNAQNQPVSYSTYIGGSYQGNKAAEV